MGFLGVVIGLEEIKIEEEKLKGIFGLADSVRS